MNDRKNELDNMKKEGIIKRTNKPTHLKSDGHSHTTRRASYLFGSGRPKQSVNNTLSTENIRRYCCTSYGIGNPHLARSQ